MAESESSLVVPLRSNAQSLLAGAPIASVRRRLKAASLYFDRVLLEAGVLRVSAGPRGSSTFMSHGDAELLATPWQTASRRHAEMQGGFQIAVGQEARAGEPADSMHVVVSSETSVSWVATLHPFADELPPDCNWVEFVRTRRPDGDVAKTVDKWTSDDSRNEALRLAIPEQFVRTLVIKDTNHDLALAAFAGAATAVDSLHAQVVAQRFRDVDSHFAMRGYAVPVLFPDTADLPWDAISHLRADKTMKRFREIMREVEHDALAEAAGGDLEAATHHAFERQLVKAAGQVDGLAASFRRTTIGLVIGASAGLLTSGITGPFGPLAGAALGSAPAGVLDMRGVVSNRRSRGWLSVARKLTPPQV